MRQLYLFVLFFGIWFSVWSQDTTLEYFISKGLQNAPSLKENNNLQKIVEFQNNIIRAQNNAFQVNATSEILVAPYFNNNGKFLDITTAPTFNAIGYDIGITNGGLYSAQVNITKNLFNKAIVDNLLFQNNVANESLALNSEEIAHMLRKNITDIYISTFLLQLQEDFTANIIGDLEKRLKVVELLVKRGILMESDYLVIQLDLENRQLEQEQLHNSFKNLYTQLGNLSGVKIIDFKKLVAPNIGIENKRASFFYKKRYVNDSVQIAADQKVFDNQYKPQVMAYGNSGLNAVEIQNMERKFGLSAGLRLTIPIYDGKQRKFNELQNKLKYENLDFYKENFEIQMKNSLEGLQQQTNTLEDNLGKMEKQLQKQENILEIYKGKLVQGQVSIIDYLNVIQNYKLMAYTKLQAQTNLWLLYNQYNFTNW